MFILVSKLLICALPRLSALCCCLGCFVSSCSRSVSLVSPCPLLPMAVVSTLACFFALTNHAPPNPFTLILPPSPLKSMTGCVRCRPSHCPALVPACSCFWHPALPVSCPAWRLPSRALSVVDCAVGNGVVHQNLGFSLTGTTSVRSASTRSRERLFPWAMIPHSLRREYEFHSVGLRLLRWTPVFIQRKGVLHCCFV